LVSGPGDPRLSQFLFNLSRADSAEESRAAIALGIGDVVPNDLAAYTEVDLIAHGATVLADHPMPRPEVTFRRLGELAHQHPLIRRGLVGAHAISDYLTVRRYHGLELYQDVYRQLGAEDQIAIELPPTRDGLVIGLALNRSRRGFDTREREILTALQPLIADSHRRVVARERAREVLREHASAAIVAVGSNGRIEFISDAARPMLESYLPERAAPSLLSEWMASRSGRRERMTISGSHGWLDLHLLPSSALEPTIIELRERRVASAAAKLTARENQVVGRLAAGESNQEIALRLGVSQRTVENHLLSAYRKLGVSNRTAAVAVLGAEDARAPVAS